MAHMSKKDLLKELAACGKDPKYFIKNYCKITHPDKGLVNFKLWDFQEDLLDDYLEHRRVIINKSRQLGISTLTAAYCAWLMLFHREKNIMIIATKFDVAGNLVKKVKKIFDNLPSIFNQLATITIDNRSSFVLSNGSQIKAAPTSVDAGRSEALSLLVVDEAAHVENFSEIWTALAPTMALGGRCVALSSPNGQGNWFHKTFIDAEKNINEFHPVTLLWNVHPERDEEWFVREKKGWSAREFAQEYLCSFNASGETVIDPEDIERIFSKIQEPRWKAGFDRNLWIWEKPEPDQKYLAICDVARGDGEDYSSIQMMKIEGFAQVAEYKGKVTPDVFANFTEDLCKEYNEALLVIEYNQLGYSVATKLVESEYPNIAHFKKGTYEFIEKYNIHNFKDSIPGFTLSVKSRPIVIAKFEEFVRNKKINLVSRRTYDELTTFIWHNGKPEAMKGHHDDLILPLSIGSLVYDYVYESSEKNVAYKRAALSGIKTSKNTFAQVTANYLRPKRLTEAQKAAQRERKSFAWVYRG